MGRQRSDGTAKLTRRESEVLALLRVGLTNAEIAERLGISFETAKHHVAQILAKLQVATREQAAVWEPEARESLWFPMIARWLLVGGAATALAGLAVLGFLVARTSSADPDRSSYAGILTGEVLYMPPPGVETIWIASPDALDEAGIHVVSGPGKMWVGGGLPEAIIIDQHWWAVINQDRPWPWFNEYKRQGVVVVGARVSMDELLSGLDAGRAADGWGGYPPHRNFYSMYSECRQNSENHSGGAQDFLDRKEETQFRLMLTRIETHIQANKACSDLTS